MAKVLWRTDVHLSDRTPSKRTGNWTEDVLNKLRWVGEKAREINADLVLDGGDFFDVKSPKLNSHSLVRATAEIHRDYPCPTYALVGNHDVKYGNISYLPEQPLGVLFATGVFHPLGEYEGISYEKIIEDRQGVKMRIVGIPYHGTEYDFERLKNLSKKGEDYLVVACHLLARSGDIGTMFEGEDIVGYDFLEQIKDVDCWCFGHWHKDQGITKLNNGAYVVNVGSLTRGSLHLDDLERAPAVVEISADMFGLTCTRHNVPVRDAQEAFKVDLTRAEKSDKDRMDAIVERMKQVATEGWSDLPLEERVKTSGLSNEVIERALSYLEPS